MLNHADPFEEEERPVSVQGDGDSFFRDDPDNDHPRRPIGLADYEINPRLVSDEFWRALH